MEGVAVSALSELLRAANDANPMSLRARAALIQDRISYATIRLATDPSVQAEAPEQCAAIIRRRNAARVNRPAARLAR